MKKKYMIFGTALLLMVTMVFGAVPTQNYFTDSGNSYISSNLGIGTDTPTAQLDIVGNFTVNTGTFAVNEQTASVGIGITQPSGKFHIKQGVSGTTPLAVANDFVLEGQDNAGISFLTNNTGEVAIFFGAPQDQNDGSIQYKQLTRQMVFRSSNTNSFYIEGADMYVYGDGSFQSITDRTKRSKLTDQELKTKIKSIDSSNDICGVDGCEINKNSYPVEWINEYQSCKVKGLNETCLEYETKKGRDLTKVVSDLVRLTKEQQITIDDLYNRVGELEKKNK